MNIFDSCKMAQQRLIDQLSSINAKGKITGITSYPGVYGHPPRYLIQIQYKDRIIEKEVTETEFGEAKTGTQIVFSPPIPECPSCACHTGICLILGILFGLAATWAIAKYATGATATILFVIVTTVILLGIYIAQCQREHNTRIKALEEALAFYQPEIAE